MFKNLVPTMEFTLDKVEVKESVGFVSLEVRRSGDLNDESSVICYTRQGNNGANAEDDFVERPKTEFSRIIFHKGQSVSFCIFDKS